MAPGQLPVDTITLPPIDHGINQAVDPTRIPDNQAVDILNWEYDRAGTALITRPGLAVTALAGGDAKITSLFGGYRKSTNATDDSQLMVTYGTKMTGQAPDNGVHLGVAGFTGGASLPSGALWQWSAMNDLVIGVNGSSVSDNPVSWNGVNFAFATQLAGSPPKGKYIAHWNGRMWILKGNRLYFSALGNAQDWTATGIAGSGFIDVGYEDGEQGTGIYATKETMFITKKTFLYRIITMVPNTDPDGWRLEIVTKNGGCMFGSTLQAFGDYLIMMSRWGLVAIQNQYTYDDFKQAVISKDIKFDFSFNLDSLAIPSVVRPDKDQYMMFVPDKDGLDNYNAYILDRAPDGVWRFVRWKFKHTLLPVTNTTVDFPVSAATVAWYSGRPRVYFGQGNLTVDEGGGFPIASSYIYTLSDTAFDDVAAVNLKKHKYDKEITTKRYTFGSAFQKTLFNEIGARIGVANTATPTKVDLALSYSLDEAQVNAKAFAEIKVPYDQSVTSDPTIWRRCSDPVQGRVGNTLQIKIKTEKVFEGVGIVIKDIAARVRNLGHHRGGNV